MTRENPGTENPQTASPHACAAASPALEAGWRGRIESSAWSVADQGVVSLGNFGTGLMLGRKLAPAEFGVYGVVLGAILFLNSIQGSLINYPLSVHGATGDPEGLRRLTGMSLLLTAIMVIPMALGVGWAAWAMKLLTLAPWIVAALILWQFQETLRRALMSQMRHRDALCGDAISYLGQAALVGLLIQTGKLNLPNVFAAIALTSLLAAAVQWRQIKPRSASRIEITNRAGDCWNLGRWAALSSLAGVVNIQLVLWTLAAAHGTAEAAKLLALGTILGVTHPALFSVGNLIVPASARAMRAGGEAGAKRVAMGYGSIGGLLVVPFYLLLALEPRLALRCFYGNASPYLASQLPLRLFAATYMLTYVVTVQGALLNGMARSRSALVIQLAMAAGTLAVTLPLTVLGGVSWSLAGACISTLAGVFAGSALLRSRARDRQHGFFVRDDTAGMPAAA